MPTVLTRFTLAQPDGGTSYAVRVCGRQADDGLWEGWIEFEPSTGSPILRTPSETRQPNLADLQYWATGLTPTYFEGALSRAEDAQSRDVSQQGAEEVPAYAGPAPARGAGAASPPATRARAILDPFHTFSQGEDILRSELNALDEAHLRRIVASYDLVGEEELDLHSMHRPGLVDLIVAAVRKRQG
jgi:hypothetical protein